MKHKYSVHYNNKKSSASGKTFILYMIYLKSITNSGSIMPFCSTTGALKTFKVYVYHPVCAMLT